MAITTISRMQQRRGLKGDLPINLAEGEFGWCLDTRELFIGNGPGFGGNAAILTQFSPNDQLITTRFKTYANSFSSSVVRMLGEKLNDAASVKDFGARGDGQTNDGTAINAAITALYQGSGAVTDDARAKRVILRMPAGVYLISASLLLYPFLTIVGEGPGRTIILLDQGASVDCMMRTADSLGEIAANIGVGASLLPQRILVANLTIDTGGVAVDAVLLERYQGVRFENVEFVGGWTSGSSAADHSAVTLSSIGTITDTVGAQFMWCDFKRFTYGIRADDLVQHTTVFQSRFYQLNDGIRLADPAVDTGPKNTVVVQNRFIEIDGDAMWNDGPNEGFTSMANFIQGTVTWGPSSTRNSSFGDLMQTNPGIIDNGTDNMIIGSTRISLGAPLGLVRMTTTQRNALTAVNGQTIYNTTANRFQGYQNGAWINLDNGSAA